jgi:hydroxyacid-oxoacid transhydrogenase
MLLAATLAGVGFGNAGVHLCHGMSYPISSQNPGYKHAGYDVDHPIIPHGVSVAVTAPAVFRFTAASNPDRHLAAAEAFGVDITKSADIEGLVEGTLPQKRVLMLAPNLNSEIEAEKDELRGLLEESLTY